MNTLRLIQPADLGRLGQDPTKLAKLCTKGELVRIRRGVYVSSEEWRQLGPLQRYGAQASAFQAVVAKQAVLCHAAAALLGACGLWGYRGNCTL